MEVDHVFGHIRLLSLPLLPFPDVLGGGVRMCKI